MLYNIDVTAFLFVRSDRNILFINGCSAMPVKAWYDHVQWTLFIHFVTMLMLIMMILITMLPLLFRCSKVLADESSLPIIRTTCQFISTQTCPMLWWTAVLCTLQCTFLWYAVHTGLCNTQSSAMCKAKCVVQRTWQCFCSVLGRVQRNVEVQESR